MTKQYVPSFTIKSFIQSEWGKGVVFKIVTTFFVLGLGYLQRRSIKNLTSKVANKVIYRARVEWIYGVFILFFASILVVSTPSAAEQGVYPSSAEKEKVKLDVNISPLYPGLNVLTMNFNNKDIEKVEVTLSMPPNYNVKYNAFKVDKGVFKLTGNLLHAAGTMNMNVKAKKFNGESVEFSFKIVIPGEMRLGES
jgi:copper transport protein